MTSPLNDDASAGRPEGPQEGSPADDAPPTQPEGSLVPPPRVPPTSIASSSDSPLPGKPRHSEPWRRPGWRPRPGILELANRILDIVDGLADNVARELRLR